MNCYRKIGSDIEFQDRWRFWYGEVGKGVSVVWEMESEWFLDVAVVVLFGRRFFISLC